MDYLEEKLKLRRLQLELDDLKEKLNKRRAELRAKELERRKKDFDKLPLEERRIREAIGWSPYKDGERIQRTCGRIEVKK